MGIDGRLIVAAWAAFLGAFAFLALSDYALFSLAGCAAGEPNCLREWIGALSGWAAAMAAGATIAVLLTQAAASRQAVEIAHQTLVSNRESSERQLRAYVVVKDVKAIGFEDEGSPAIMLEIENMGQTPAHQGLISFELLIAPPNAAPFSSPTTAGQFTDLGPGQTIDAQNRIDGDAIIRAWAEIEKGKLNLWCWGDIRYRDAFGQSRMTEYRAVYDPDPGRFIFVPGSTMV